MGTYMGRVRHYFSIFNPMNSFYSNSQIHQMQAALSKHRMVEKEAKAQGKEVYLSDAEINGLRKY